jgi:predicted 3-demethylubiquinone-9 3-methyltransferase (glyoxalase superfamily)
MATVTRDQAFEAMMQMRKIGIAAIAAARRG